MNTRFLNLQRSGLLIAFSIVVLYFVFSPAVNILYYSGDDFRYALGGITKSCRGDDGFHFMITIGRPMQAYLDCLSYKFAYTLEHMRILRFVSVALIGAAVGLFAEWLYCLGFSFGIALLASACVFLIQHLYGDTLPFGAIALPFTILITIMAYLLLQRATTWLSKCLAGSLLFLAMLTYPAIAFFFCTLILTKILFLPLTQWMTTRRGIFFEIGFFCMVGALYFVWGYYNMHYHARTPIPEAYQLSHPNLNLFEMAKRLVWLSNVFEEHWALSPRSNHFWQGIVMLVLLAGGLLSACISLFKNHLSKTNACQALLAAIAVFILSSAFFLVMPSLSLIENRVLFGVITSGFLLVFWSLYQISLRLPKYTATLIVMALSLEFFLQGYQANVVTMGNALSHQEYLNDTRSVIATHLANNKQLQRIHFVIPRSNYPYDRFFMAYVALMQLLGRDQYTITWCSLPRGQNGNELEHTAATFSCIHDSSKIQNNIAITYSYEEDEFPKTPNMVVVKNHYQDVDPTKVESNA